MIKKAGLGDRKVFNAVGSSQAGKGDDPRPVDADKWYNAPIWDVMGPEARKRREARECCQAECSN